MGFWRKRVLWTEGIASINFPSGNKSMLIVTGLVGKRLDLRVTQWHGVIRIGKACSSS